MQLSSGSGHQKATQKRSLLESLPYELHSLIVDCIYAPPSQDYSTLLPLLLTSKLVHDKTVRTLYLHIAINRRSRLQRLVRRLETKPGRGAWLRCLDFSCFNPLLEESDPTPLRLAACLQMAPSLQQFLGQEYVEADLNEVVLRHLLSLPSLQVLDLCGCSSAAFCASFGRALEGRRAPSALRMLSLHQCISLPADTFSRLLPTLACLTRLDVANTRITDAGLWSLPDAVRLTHLSVASCRALTTDGLLGFLAEHRAVRGRLVALNISRVGGSALGSADVSRLLRVLPRRLRSLDLRGSAMATSNMPFLEPLLGSLVELALGVVPTEEVEGVVGQLSRMARRLCYLDVTCLGFDISHFRALLASSPAPLRAIEVTEAAGEQLVQHGLPGWQCVARHARCMFLLDQDIRAADIGIWQAVMNRHCL